MHLKNNITEIVTCGMGFNTSGFQGAFTKPVIKIIENTISGKILHLFSGTSMIGDVRIDIEHSNATNRMDVKEFIKTDKREWDWVVLDPPYEKVEKMTDYKIQSSFSSDVELRNLIREFIQKRTRNVLWLDYCAPMIKGFRRKRLWLLLPGGFHNVRILSWLQKEGDLRKFKEAIS